MYVNELEKNVANEIIETFNEDSNAWLEYFNDYSLKLNGKSGTPLTSPLTFFAINHALKKGEIKCKDETLNHLWFAINTVKKENLWKQRLNGEFEKPKVFAHSESPCYRISYRMLSDPKKWYDYSITIRKRNGEVIERNYFFANELDEMKKRIEAIPGVDTTNIVNSVVFIKANALYHASQLDEAKIKKLIDEKVLVGERKSVADAYADEKKNTRKIPDMDKVKVKGEENLPTGKIYMIKEIGKTMYANHFQLDTHTNPLYAKEIKAYLETLNEKNKYVEIKDVLAKARGIAKSLIQLDKEKRIRKEEELVLSKE